MIQGMTRRTRSLLDGSALRAFRTDTQGNIAMMTGFTLTMLMLAMGAAFDYSRAIQRSNDIQNIVDAAVLAGASTRGKSEAEVRDQVIAVINGYNREGWDLSIDVQVDGDNISVTVGNAPQTMFGSLMGRESTPIKVQTGSPRAQDTPVHLALVLDTTDSMDEGGNLPAMQAAAKELIDAAEELPNGTRVSIVPFGNYVNIGPQNRDKAWLDLGKDGQSGSHCYTSSIEVTAPTCTNHGEVPYTHRVDGLNMGTRMRDDVRCEGGVYEDGPEVCTTINYNWYGCMGSREDGWAEVAKYNGRKYPAALNRSCGTKLMPLSQNWNDMRDHIDNLVTSGATYLPSGLSWGWRTLTPQHPFNEANSHSGPRLNRAMLFMTDGLNTKSVGGEDPDGDVTLHDGYDADAGLTMTDTVCQNIKEAGIELFIVAYRVPGQTDTVETLQTCASSSAHFFTPDNAGELKASFMDVAKMLDSTRIAF